MKSISKKKQSKITLKHHSKHKDAEKKEKNALKERNSLSSSFYQG
ncbi:MAG: hypothetical protein V4494_08040 [Chlamydiota bacterium]